MEVGKNKERLTNCHRLENAKDLLQLNAMWYSGLNLGTEKQLLGKVGKIWKKVYNLVVSIMPMWIF